MWENEPVDYILLRADKLGLGVKEDNDRIKRFLLGQWLNEGERRKEEESRGECEMALDGRAVRYNVAVGDAGLKQVPVW
jgi:hypothetical protein